MALAGDHVQVLVDGYDLTGDMNSVNFNDMRSLLKAGVFGDAVEKHVPGQRQIKLEHKGLMEAAAARAHPVLKGLTIENSVSVLLGQNAAPVNGDLTYSMVIRQEKYQTMPEVNKVIPFTASFVNRGLMGGWGIALAVPGNITNTTNGTINDNGAATTKGGAAYLHILQAGAGDTYSIIVQGSTTGAFAGEETTLATFALNASAVGSDRQALPTTVPRYVRYRGVRTGVGNTVRLAVALVRFSE